MALKLFNSMGRKLEVFTPITPGFVGFYGCGPTVYNYAHIGNLRAYVFLDILDRTLTFLSYDKKHVMNVTDIGHLTGDTDTGEDKMLRAAAERHKSVMEVAEFFTKAFMDDIGKLNIITPDVVCYATEHIVDMIALIKRIEANGHTYFSGGNLYYDVTTYSDYGALAGLDMDKLLAGARIEVDKNKKNPYDFVLWFTKSKYENQALVWDSPWGCGYPGWHIECSAMSMKYLGEHFDIHTGGIDHIPIHHTNEIAQSEGATGKKWVNYWLHNEFLVIGKTGESVKMSKSEGNFLRLQTLLEKGYSALDYRYFLLTGHYRKQLYFSYSAMEGAKNARQSLVKKVLKVLHSKAVSENKSEGFIDTIESLVGKKYKTGEALLHEGLTPSSYNYLVEFKDALENDLSTPKALSVLSKLLKDASVSFIDTLTLISRFDSVLGLKLLEAATFLYKTEKSAAVNNFTSTVEGSDEGSEELNRLLKERQAAKENKDYVKADSIRDKLKELGYIVVDTKEGVKLKRV